MRYYQPLMFHLRRLFLLFQVLCSLSNDAQGVKRDTWLSSASRVQRTIPFSLQHHLLQDTELIFEARRETY